MQLHCAKINYTKRSKLSITSRELRKTSVLTKVQIILLLHIDTIGLKIVQNDKII